MYKRTRARSVLLIFGLVASFLTACSGGGASSENHTDAKRTTYTEFLTPSASGTTVLGNEIVTVDASNTAEGYVMVCYQGTAEKVKLQITTPEAVTYSYNLRTGNYETFPLSGESGDYEVKVLEHVQDEMYAVSFSTLISATISDEFKPFLYPNQYVWFESGDKTTALGMEISERSSNDLDYVEQVYRYVIEHITYDDVLAETVQADYLPVNDKTLEAGKGICFDYASLMAALLRSQNIPTKLEVGYSGDAYHAWISVYLKEKGWVNGIIEFDGTSWSLMDPTLAANNSDASVKKYVGDGSNYTVKYSY